MTKITFVVEDESLVQLFNQKVVAQDLTHKQAFTALMQAVVTGTLNLSHLVLVMPDIG